MKLAIFSTKFFFHFCDFGRRCDAVSRHAPCGFCSSFIAIRNGRFTESFTLLQANGHYLFRHRPGAIGNIFLLIKDGGKNGRWPSGWPDVEQWIRLLVNFMAYNVPNTMIPSVVLDITPSISFHFKFKLIIIIIIINTDNNDGIK